MPFDKKDWENAPSTDTPVSAAALIDAEDRLSDYTDSIAAGGVELEYAEITEDVTTTSTTLVDVDGLEVTATVGSRPINIIFSCPAAGNAAGGGVSVAILEDDVIIGACGLLQTTINSLGPLHRTIRRNPAAGAHTYKIQFKAVLTGTAKLTASDGSSGTEGPTSIQVIEV